MIKHNISELILILKAISSAMKLPWETVTHVCVLQFPHVLLLCLLLVLQNIIIPQRPNSMEMQRDDPKTGFWNFRYLAELKCILQLRNEVYMKH